MASAFAVFGYEPALETALTRLASVAKRVHDAELLLCHRLGQDAPEHADVHHSLSLDLWPERSNGDAVTAYARQHDLELVGVLPLTEAGVALAALVAQSLDLPGPDLPRPPEEVPAAAAAPAGSVPSEGAWYTVHHVAGLTWVSEREELPDGHGTVVQEIVPGELAPSSHRRLVHAALSQAHRVGYQGCAFHYRALLGSDGQVAHGELHLYPEGARMWDLAGQVFAPLDPWASWAAWAHDGRTASGGLSEVRGVAGIRRLRAPRDGMLTEVPDGDFYWRMEKAFPQALREIVFTRSAGDTVTHSVRAEADWLGHVICVTPSREATSRGLTTVAEQVQGVLRIV